MSWVYVTGKHGKGGKDQGKGKGIPCPTQLRDGDWNCSMCGQHNFARREQCMTCYFPAPVKAGYRGKSGGKGNDKGKGKGKTVEEKGKGKGKGVVPGLAPTTTQSRNARRRAAKKAANADGQNAAVVDKSKEKDVEINRLKKELAAAKDPKKNEAADVSVAEKEEEQEAIPSFSTSAMKPLMKSLGLQIEESKDSSKLLAMPSSKTTGTAEETVNKLLKTNTAAEEAIQAARYYKEKVDEAEMEGSTVPQTILENLKGLLADAEKVSAKKSEDNEVALDNMKAVRSRLKASETARLQKEAESKEKAAERAKARKEALEEFSVAVTKRIAEHLEVEAQAASTWELHHTTLAARATEELALVDAQILKTEAAVLSKKPAGEEKAEADPKKDADMDGEPAKQQLLPDSDVLKAMQEQLLALQNQLAQHKIEATAAVNDKARELQALSTQRSYEIAFLRTVEDMDANAFKAASNSPTEEAKHAMIRTHQVLTEWSNGGASCMFTTKHLDVWAGLNGETCYLLEHLMGGKQQKKTWVAWFPEKPTNESVVPRQMARTLLQLLTKTRKVWEQSEEHSKTVRQETDGLYTALSQEAKRRCLAVTTA